MISFRSTHPIILEKLPYFELEETSNQYDLFYSKNGILLQSIHSKEKSIVVYSYDDKQRLISSLKMNILNNIFIEISGFIYDSKGRIKLEKCQASYKNSFFEEVYNRNHKYKGNTEEIFTSSNIEFDPDYHIIKTYNNLNQVIEEKSIRNNKDLVYWDKNEYDNSCDLIKSTTLSDKGDLICTKEFFPQINGMYTGHKHISKNAVFSYEHKYIFNKKGHWINQGILRDGVPHTYYDREIIYH